MNDASDETIVFSNTRRYNRTHFIAVGHHRVYITKLFEFFSTSHKLFRSATVLSLVLPLLLFNPDRPSLLTETREKCEDIRKRYLHLLSVYTKLKQENYQYLDENTRKFKADLNFNTNETSTENLEKLKKLEKLEKKELKLENNLNKAIKTNFNENLSSDSDEDYQFFYVQILTKLADVAGLTFFNKEQFVDNKYLGKLEDFSFLDSRFDESGEKSGRNKRQTVVDRDQLMFLYAPSSLGHANT